ncbi:hypothetical protein ALC62_12496 [Cyphomyrmex costatus]|uniref:Uncharacterized protein n=1 Tax=Cyphomyrmex costatus TaxID=456900 RepID=A0A151IAY2_9HYME|nr:hypothetical protein ALC62_12496 [Cyphomyrmex costatus]
MSRASTQKKQIFILTTIPVEWSTRKIAKEFDVSRRAVSSAKKLRNEKGYCTEPDKKKGRPLRSDVINKVAEFYLSDDVSRVMPGDKSVKTDRKRTQERFSEYENHDATAVHLYNSKMIRFLKKKFGVKNVKKLFYFSDGAGSQYKNRFNFLNLLYHEKDFKIKAEWHFFATAHGKGACDGIGGCVKKNAYRASLQDKTIVSTEKLFEWASNYFKKINFDFCNLSQYKKHAKVLEKRFKEAKTISGTRQFHCYKPLDSNSVECKIFSNYSESTVVKIVKK